MFCLLGEEAVALENLKKKMKTNIEHAKERVNFLCEFKLFLSQ